MSDDPNSKPYTLNFEEKATPVMVYTELGVIKGELVSKELVRVNTWLRTPYAPEYMCIYEAQCLLFTGTGSMQSLSFREYYLTPSQVIAYHILPPAEEPMDYDESEPNRKFEPITMLVGTFRFDGKIHMSAQASLHKHIEGEKEAFTSLYDVNITNPGVPNMGTLHIPLLLVRPDRVGIAIE
jgi:hypothetical protein